MTRRELKIGDRVQHCRKINNGVGTIEVVCSSTVVAVRYSGLEELLYQFADLLAIVTPVEELATLYKDMNK